MVDLQTSLSLEPVHNWDAQRPSTEACTLTRTVSLPFPDSSPPDETLVRSTAAFAKHGAEVVTGPTDDDNTDTKMPAD